MSSRDATGIDRKDIRKYPRRVQDLVLYLVNDEGLRWRDLGQDHLVLYPPDGEGRPFKIGAHRREEDQVEFIERQFMKVYGIAGPDGTVPYAKEEEVAVAATEEKGIWGSDGEPAEAVRTLAAALGVSLGGTVSEEDYLAVVHEKDECQREAEKMAADLLAEGNEIRVRDETIADLIRQRDHLLNQLTRIAEITTEEQ